MRMIFLSALLLATPASSEPFCAMFCPSAGDAGVCKLVKTDKDCTCTCALLTLDDAKKAELEKTVRLSVGPQPGFDGLLALSPTWPNDTTSSGDAGALKDVVPDVNARTEMDHPAHQPMDNDRITWERIQREKIIEAAGKLLDSMRSGK